MALGCRARSPILEWSCRICATELGCRALAATVGHVRRHRLFHVVCSLSAAGAEPLNSYLFVSFLPPFWLWRNVGISGESVRHFRRICEGNAESCAASKWLVRRTVIADWEIQKFIWFRTKDAGEGTMDRIIGGSGSRGVDMDKHKCCWQRGFLEDLGGVMDNNKCYWQTS